MLLYGSCSTFTGGPAQLHQSPSNAPAVNLSANCIVPSKCHQMSVHLSVAQAYSPTLVGIILYLICILVVYTSRFTTFDLSTIRCSEVVVTPASQRRRRDTSYWNKLPECHCVILDLMICSAHTCCCIYYLCALPFTCMSILAEDMHRFSALWTYFRT